MKSGDKMITAIRSRNGLPPTYISLKKLLDKGSMSRYLKLCSDRLAESDMIDGQDIQINFADFPDIIFTSDGFFSCRHILENYLPFDMLADVWQLLIETERDCKQINDMAAAFRKMKFWDLLKYYIKWRSYKTNDDSEQEAKHLAGKWIVEELCSRSFFSGIWRKAREALQQIYVKIKYREIFGVVRSFIGSYSES